MDIDVETDLKEIVAKLEEINKKLECLRYLSNLSQLGEIATALRLSSPEPDHNIDIKNLK